MENVFPAKNAILKFSYVVSLPMHNAVFSMFYVFS
jgi:hypothetical protein